MTCVGEFYDKESFDWSVLLNAGLTRDATDLPHHVSTEQELSGLCEQFRTFLRSLESPPTAITISRSSEDNYCPPEQVDSIQENVLNILEELYGKLNVVKSYGQFLVRDMW